MATKPELYEPDLLEDTALDRDVDRNLHAKLTGRPAVEDLASALKAAAFQYDPDDIVTIGTAEDYQVTDSDAYVRGYELLGEVGALEDRITHWYARFDKPLNFLIGVVRACKSPQAKQVATIKKALSGRLGVYKAQRDEEARRQREAEQKARDEAARAERQAQAEAAQRLANTEPNPALAASFKAESQAIAASVPFTSAAPVEQKPAVPAIPGGYTRTDWTCEYVDLKELLRAYVDGKCVLDEDAIKKGLQSFMDTQAAALTTKLGQAYPGTRAVPRYGAVQRKAK